MLDVKSDGVTSVVVAPRLRVVVRVLLMTVLTTGRLVVLRGKVEVTAGPVDVLRSGQRRTLFARVIPSAFVRCRCR